MKIGLIDCEQNGFPNLALMKLSAYHKMQKDHVEFFQPLFSSEYNKIYLSKIFSFTKIPYSHKLAIKGGSGISLITKLEDNIEHIYPDYSLYNMNYAMGYLTRGCINRCPFCIVRKKEGFLKKHADLEEFWHDQKEIMLLDNSLTDHPNADLYLRKIRDNGLKLNLTQGFNIRTISRKIAEILAEIRLWKNKQWHIAWDNINEEKQIFSGIQILNQAGIKNWKLMCFVLIGFNSNYKQDMYRIKKLEKNGIDAFVMPYQKNLYTKALSKWCNRKQICKSVDFLTYIKAKKNYKQIQKLM